MGWLLSKYKDWNEDLQMMWEQDMDEEHNLKFY